MLHFNAILKHSQKFLVKYYSENKVPKNGLLSAYRAGCKPIMVPDLWQPDEEITRLLFAKFSDLEEVQEYFMNRDS